MATLAAKGASIDVRESLLWPSTGSATVDVVDRDGTAVASDLPATYDSTDETWKVSLTHVHTAAPGLLSLTWTHSTGATATSEVDVRNGNPYPTSTLAKFTARGGGTYSATKRQEAMQQAVESLEDACGVALVTQRSTLTLKGTGTTFRPAVHNITAVVEGDCEVSSGGRLVFTGTVTDPTVVVDHGYAALDPSAARAVALLASSYLADGPWDDRGAVIGEGGTMMRLMTAGMGGSRFSIPEVQEFYRRRKVLLVA